MNMQPVHHHADISRLRMMPRPQLWVMAARLKTLGLSITPVLAGSWLAAERGSWNPGIMVACLISATAIQIGTNLWNDVADAASGADREDRLGPPRVTSLGLLDATSVRLAAALAFAVAAAFGAGLVWSGGWPILIIGLASLGFGYAYSMGPLPLSGTPLGEVLVMMFFGIIAVTGTCWLQAREVLPAAYALGFVIGLPAAAVLLVNNHRDRASDARAGRRTLAILAGERVSRLLYALLVVAPPFLLLMQEPWQPMVIVQVLLLMAWAGRLSLRMWRLAVSPGLNALLPATATYQLGILVSAVLVRALQ